LGRIYRASFLLFHRSYRKENRQRQKCQVLNQQPVAVQTSYGSQRDKHMRSIWSAGI
jgi:primosomal replication protein N